jgi:glycosyltransferase involved in cell wall biosynthesis
MEWGPLSCRTMADGMAGTEPDAGAKRSGPARGANQLTRKAERGRSRRPRFLLTFLAWATGVSGGDRHLLEVAARWREHVDIGVLAPPEAFETIRVFLEDVPGYELGSAGPRQATLGPMLALEYVRRSVSATARDLPAADVVVAASHFTPDASALAKLVRRGALGVSYVYHLVGDRAGRGPRTLWSKADERIGLTLLRRSAGAVFVPNNQVAATLAARGFDPVYTRMGVDVSSFRPRAPASLPPQAAFVARMAHTKGVTDAVQAWALVRRSVPDARLRMVGDGPERAPATALAERLGISDAIEWRGFVSEPEKIRQVLSESRLLLAPSYEEGFGISVCEALAAAVPVVAYRLPVLDELFDSAYLGASTGDVAGLAEHAVQVLADDSVAETMSRRGRATAERYDLARVADQELETILGRLAAR